MKTITYNIFKQQICNSCNEWNTYANDKTTVEYICAMVNSGIATINKFNQVRVKTQ